MIRVTPSRKEAVELFHHGSLAMAECELNGWLIDREYCSTQIANQEKRVKSVLRKLDSSELGMAWRTRYGRDVNYGADNQLRQVLYEDLKAEVQKKTSGGKRGTNKLASVDADSLERSGREDVKLLLKKRNIETLINFLKNIHQESEPDGYVHPFFHLSEYDNEQGGGAGTYRSSSSSPNLQNQPHRVENDAKVVRRAFVARPGCRLVGRDYSGIEVAVSAMYHRDPNMIKYIERGDDMHRDCASMAFMLPPDQCTKKAGRYGDVWIIDLDIFYYSTKGISSSWNGLIEGRLRLEARCVSSGSIHHPISPEFYRSLWIIDVRAFG